MPDIRYLRMMTGGVPVVTAPPEIDITSADQLRAVLLDTAIRGHATVVVDLTGTRFCDSRGVHTLLRAHKLAQADGGELRLVVPADGAVPRIFALLCLDRLIPCFASLDEALAQAPAAANLRGDDRGPDADQPPMQTGIHAGSEAVGQTACEAVSRAVYVQHPMANRGHERSQAGIKRRRFAALPTPSRPKNLPLSKFGLRQACPQLRLLMLAR